MKLVTALAITALLPACSSSTPASGGAEDAGGGSSVATPSGSSSGGASTGGSSSSGGSAAGGSSSSGDTASEDAGSPSSDGGSASGGASGGGATDGAKLVLTIPSSFTGATRELDVVVVKSLPVAGPPTSVLYQLKTPVVTAGQSLTIEGDTTGVDGSYYVVAVLYMQGGGTFSPSPGIDYEAQTSTTMTFTGGAIDLGTLPLTLVPTDGGP